MNEAPLHALVRLRRIERRQAELDLAAATRAVTEAKLAQTAWENRIRQHATAADPLALLAWLPAARAAIASAQAGERAAERRRDTARQALAWAKAAEDAAERMLAERKLETAREEGRRALRELPPPAMRAVA